MHLQVGQQVQAFWAQLAVLTGELASGGEMPLLASTSGLCAAVVSLAGIPSLRPALRCAARVLQRHQHEADPPLSDSAPRPHAAACLGSLAEAMQAILAGAVGSLSPFLSQTLQVPWTLCITPSAPTPDVLLCSGIGCTLGWV